ncbi:hypothetical protein DHEL01_v200332 [Diaporthe helianthi]|uniref:Endonuclease/exonuclease/phosphatase domain-containing protein n=1 Tax=Diaporthe helianthi TaxID=158607 RepID=A0A2P5IFK0_DIAHE|nr:hypothetical protein DHEL01_v200332 [Diaporthe helianthi]
MTLIFRAQKRIKMSLISSIRNRYLSWSHSTPLPDLPGTAPPVFQHWHAFNKTTSNWEIVQPDLSKTSTPIPQEPNLRLLTWNIDAFGEKHESRIEAILSKIRQMQVLTDTDENTNKNNRGLDIIFLQEVSKKALSHLLKDTWVQETWISSEADETNWAGGVPFATTTLLSRSRFQPPISNPHHHPSSSPGTTPDSAWGFSLGPVWRVRFPSRFQRDALCCDILWDRTTRIRLVNVHLDSLPIEPSLRPRQVSIAADLLRAAGDGAGAGAGGRGVIAGDWNPVTEGDADLVGANGLVDAWEQLRPGEDGFTWGLDGKGEPFPPGRLDKVAVLGLRVTDIEVVHPGTLQQATDAEGDTGVPWSDHSGLICSFTHVGTAN